MNIKFYVTCEVKLLEAHNLVLKKNYPFLFSKCHHAIHDDHCLRNGYFLPQITSNNHEFYFKSFTNALKYKNVTESVKLKKALSPLAIIAIRATGLQL